MPITQRNLQYNILIAEDDPDIVNLLRLYIESDGGRVIAAANGVEALEAMGGERIDLAVLDIMMPLMDGYTLMKEIRRTENFPIIIISAKDRDSDKILGLDLGADDYLSKPFNPLEAVARINANLRRFHRLGAGRTDPEQGLEIGALRLDTEKHRLFKDGRQVLLTPTEYRILSLLMKAPGRIFTKAQIYEAIFGPYFESCDSTMMVHISNLRDKIEDDPKAPGYIKTIRGLGYTIEKR